MSKNYLLIVEGEVTEKSILSSILKKCDVNIFDCGRIELKGNIRDIFATKYEISNKDKIFLVQGPRNRIHDWLKLINTQYDDFERFFLDIEGLFAGIFIVYDVDHTSREELETMFRKYCDETDRGLLLLSSPCIEVLADVGRKNNLNVLHLKEYKVELNKRYQQQGIHSAEQYIIDNFERLVLFYLDKNTIESGSTNIMEHPEFILKMINEQNDRMFISNKVQPVYYRYFTTVIYVCIAYIKGLTKEIDNSATVKDFFESLKEINKVQ